ncbi:MAG: leucine-rich repeat domain-containing protein [Lachnospiraceae bacterium]|nr:leucine-rich repeat domain-containing protein [Lachnospiraceae bacterium]
MATLKLKSSDFKKLKINEEAFDGKILSQTIGEKEATVEFDTLTHIGSKAIRNSYIFDLEVPSTVTRIEPDAFSGLGNIKAACVDENQLEIVDGELVACFQDGLDFEVTIPEGVTVIGENAFAKSGVKKITLPKTVKRLGKRSLSSNRLTSVKLNKGLEEMGEECLYWTDIKTLTIPDTVTTIGDRAFGKSRELTKIKIGKGVTSIGSSILIGSRKLKEITGKYATDDHLALIFEDRFVAYAAKDPLESYSIPDGVKIIGRGAFNCALNLKEIHIPDSVCDIEPQAFSATGIRKFIGKFTTEDNRCVIVGNRFIAFHNIPLGQGPESLTVPENVTEICDEACYNVGYLESVELHDGITTIGEAAFFNNWHLKMSQALPAALETIGKRAFEIPSSWSDCANFKDGVVVPPSVRYIGLNGLYTYMFWFSSETPPVWEYFDRLIVKAIFVPEHLIEKYKEAYPWYADKIEEWEC